MKENQSERKSIRLHGYDYSSAGCYFATICIKDRQELLGQIVGDAALGVPDTVLSDLGKMVQIHIERIKQQQGVTLENYVIMPNHIHLLICINDNVSTSGTPRATSPTKATIPQIVNALKGLTSKK